MTEDARKTFSTKPAMEMYVKMYRWMIYVLIGRGKKRTSLKTLDIHHFM